MNMTLSEAIERCEKIIREAKIKYEVSVDDILAKVGIELTKKGVEEYRQYVKWLKELQERRNADDAIPFSKAGEYPFTDLDSIINAYEAHGDYYKVVVELLKELRERRKQQENDWILVSERLPKKSGEYYVTEKRYGTDDMTHSGRYTLETAHVIFEDGRWRRAKFYEVIAWKPKPEPYKG